MIVSRGEEYFDDGAVKGLKKINDGEWVASVEGTELYKVRILLKGDTIYSYSCSCPYDMGLVCKHVVAVFFALQRPTKPKSREKTFEQTISAMTREKLNAILIDYARQEPGFVDYVSARCVINTPSSDKEEYRRIIRNAVDTVRGKHGYIDYWQASRAVKGEDMVLDKAQEFLKKQQPSRALQICQCVLEEMVPLLQEADDSNGSIGDVIGQAFQVLSECARQVEDAGFRKGLLTYLLKECDNGRYEGWNDWRWEILVIASEVVQSDKEVKNLFNRIDEIESKHGNLRYDYENATVIKMKVLERLGTKEDVKDFLNQHLDCTPLREQAIKNELKCRDYLSARKLALDGLAQDKARGLPGLINTWTRHLLDIAEAQKDYPEVKKYSMQLFLDTNDFTFYEQYKKCFTAGEWPRETQKIVDSIRNSKDNRNYALALPQIYIREELWPDLMDFVQESNSSRALENFSEYLVKLFPEKLADAYEKVIIEKLAPLLGRGNYQYLREFLKRFKKLGDKERVSRLVAKLSEKYSNRPAMLEELKHVQ